MNLPSDERITRAASWLIYHAGRVTWGAAATWPQGVEVQREVRLIREVLHLAFDQEPVDLIRWTAAEMVPMTENVLDDFDAHRLADLVKNLQSHYAGTPPRARGGDL